MPNNGISKPDLTANLTNSVYEATLHCLSFKLLLAVMLAPAAARPLRRATARWAWRAGGLTVGLVLLARAPATRGQAPDQRRGSGFPRAHGALEPPVVFIPPFPEHPLSVHGRSSVRMLLCRHVAWRDITFNGARPDRMRAKPPARSPEPANPARAHTPHARHQPHEFSSACRCYSRLFIHSSMWCLVLGAWCLVLGAGSVACTRRTRPDSATGK